MTRFAVLLGGDLTVTARLRRQIAGARVIAADSGMRHAEALGCEVELWAGDFDSAAEALVARHPGVPRDLYPQDKDRTDGDIAIGLAIERGASEIVLVGALGGQSDHIFGNLTMCLRLAFQGIAGIATSGTEEAYPLIPGRRELDIPPASRVSIVALTDISGLTLTGMRWPLTNRDVPLGSSLTLSNIAVGPVHIELGGGHGIAFAFDGPWATPENGR